MRFLQRDVNKSLLVLNMFFLLLFIGFTVYYQSALTKTREEREVYDQKISQITAQAVLQKLNRSDSAKDIALIDKAILEDKYGELLGQKEKMELEKEKLERQIVILNSQIEYSDARIEGPVAQFRLIQGKNEQIEELSKKINSLCILMKSYNLTSEEC